MTFEVGKLSAALTLQGVDQFHRELDSAGQKLQDVGQRGASFGRAAESAIRTAAGATTGLVTAAGAYLTILTKTGISYNSLQQNSRAALSVLLGGTEQANAQMAKLDDFARNSPFSKSVFIEAQQQLLGFGMEAGKVIPTLDAIQQSMAAMGRGNEDIQEVVRVLAQVTSTGKFTGITLQQLGVRGVDAATLIGERMGKTGAEIREAITDGTIGGEEALDHLIASMDTKFGGAADLVKEQWSGATDRIKAANRDLGAVIAEPFVSAEGGGMAVTWGNQVADVLRAIEKQAVPVMGILTQRSMPFFSSLTQGLDRTQQAIQRWDAGKLEVSLDKLSGHAPALAATAGALLAVGAQAGPLGKLLRTVGISANPAVAAFVGLAAASPEVRDGLKAVLEAGKPLVTVAGDLAKVLSGQLNSALPVVSGGVEALANVLGVALSIVEKIPTPVIAGGLAFLALHKAITPLSGLLTGVTSVFQRLIETSGKAYDAGLRPVTAGLAGISDAAAPAVDKVKGLGNALKAAFIANPIGIAITAIATALGVWAMANAKAQQKVEEHRQQVSQLKDTLNQTTGELGEATQAQIENALSQGDVADTLEKAGVSYREAAEAAIAGGSAIEDIASRIASTQGVSYAAYEEATEAIRDQHRALEASQQAVRDAIQADREMAASMTEAARSNQRFNDALQVARDITQDTETRVRALKQALDELKGGAISAEEAEKRLSETNLNLAEGLAQTTEEGERLWASTLDGAGKIDLASREGIAFADSMGYARDAMLDAAMAAADQALANGDVAGALEAATTAGEGYIATLRETMAEAGLTEAQIEGLIGTYLDVPSMVATLITDNGTISEADQQLLSLGLKLDELGEGQTIEIDEPDSPEILDRLKELGVKLETLPEGKVRITATGQDIVESILNGLTAPRTATVHIAQGLGGAGGITKADGGVVQRSGSGWLDMQSFANGGFPTGIYQGGPPLIKFAEPETGWEAFISGRAGQEERNAKIAMDALNRLGFPVVPVSALRGVPAFADGGMVSRSSPTIQSRPTAPERVHVRRKRNAPLAEVINVGVEAQTNDLRKLAQILDRLDREG